MAGREEEENVILHRPLLEGEREAPFAEVEDFLRNAHLQNRIETFRNARIDTIEDLRELTPEEMTRELNLAVGERKKLQRALAASSPYYYVCYYSRSQPAVIAIAVVVATILLGVLALLMEPNQQAQADGVTQEELSRVGQEASDNVTKLRHDFLFQERDRFEKEAELAREEAHLQEVLKNISRTPGDGLNSKAALDLKAQADQTAVQLQKLNATLQEVLARDAKERGSTTDKDQRDRLEAARLRTEVAKLQEQLGSVTREVDELEAKEHQQTTQDAKHKEALSKEQVPKGQQQQQQASKDQDSSQDAFFLSLVTVGHGAWVTYQLCVLFIWLTLGLEVCGNALCRGRWPEPGPERGVKAALAAGLPLALFKLVGLSALMFGTDIELLPLWSRVPWDLYTIFITVALLVHTGRAIAQGELLVGSLWYPAGLAWLVSAVVDLLADAM